jgi:hypothetical protein
LPSELADLEANPMHRLDLDPAWLAPGSEAQIEHDYDHPMTVGLRTVLDASVTPPLDASNIADRMTNQTCAGCHHLTSNADLGGGEHAASSMGFLHVAETGSFSHGLLEVFLPQRELAMNDYLASPGRDGCGAPWLLSLGSTIGPRRLLREAPGPFQRGRIPFVGSRPW